MLRFVAIATLIRSSLAIISTTVTYGGFYTPGHNLYMSNGMTSSTARASSTFIVGGEIPGGDSDKTYLHATNEYQANQARIKLFDLTANLLGSYLSPVAMSSSNYLRQVMQFTESVNEVYFGNPGDRFERILVQASNPSTYTFTAQGHVVTNAHGATFSVVVSNYLITFPRGDVNKNFQVIGVKVDMSTATFTTYTANLAADVYLSIVIENDFLLVSSATYLSLFEYTGMTWIKNMTTAAPGYVVDSMAYDPEETRYIASTSNNYLHKLHPMDFTADSFYVLEQVHTGYRFTDIVLNTNYNSFMAVSTSNYFHLFKKSNLAVLLTITFLNPGIPGTLMRYKGDLQATHRRIYHGFLTRNGGTSETSMNQFYIRLDLCDATNGSGDCIQCGNSSHFGFTVMRNSPHPQCMTTNNCPAETGFSSYIAQCQPCTDSGCSNCNTGINKCFSCKSGYRLSLPYTCQLDSTFYAGWAMWGSIKVPCKDANCYDCQFDWTGCQKCHANYMLVNGRCVLTWVSSVAYGYDSVSGQYLPCQSTGCTNCNTNYQVCTACDNTIWPPYYLVTANSSCIPWYWLPANTGLSWGSSPFRPFPTTACSVSYCANCTYNYLTCEECAYNVTVQRFLIGGSCVDVNSLPPGYGKNTSSTENATRYGKCASSQCNDCKGDLNYCYSCTSPSALVNGACVPLLLVPSGYGVTGVARSIIPCAVANCIDCAGNGATACNRCGGGYYAKNNLCHLPSSIGATEGADLANGTVRACSDPYCSICRTNYQVCTQCSGGGSAYLYQGRCIAKTALPSLIGAVTDGTWSTTSCIDPNCLNCQNDYRYCQACKPNTSPQYYLYAATSGCILASSIPANFGYDDQTFMVVACPSNCQYCTPNFRLCSQCKSSPTAYYLLNGACYLPSSLPNYYGAAASYVATPCQDSNCKTCKNSYTVCTLCEPYTSPMTYLYTSNSSCLLASQIPSGYGGYITSTGNGIIYACNVANCINCQSDYLTCTRCATNSPPYYVHNNLCVLETNLPAGYGGNVLTYASEACASSNCLTCKNNYQQCQTCKTLSPAVYYHLPTLECLLPADIPNGYGANLATGNTSVCALTGCVQCQQNYIQCVGCTALGNGSLTYLYQGNCIPLVNIPMYYGADNATLTAKSCIEPRCKYCQSDYMTCTECIYQNPELYLDSNGATPVCLTVVEISSGYGADLSTLKVRACNVPGCSNCASNFRICSACNSSQVPAIYFYEGACLEVANIPNPFGANVLTTTADRCADANCKSCKSNYGFCVDCSRVDPETFLFAVYGTCWKKTDLPNGWGPDYSTYTVRPCEDPNCRVCTSNYKKCSTCNSSPVQYYVFGTGCIRMDQFGETYGADNSTWTVQTCNSLGCIDCKTNYQECWKCAPPPENPSPQNPKYYLYEKRCDTCQNKPLKVVDYECKSFCDKPGCYVKLLGVKFSKARAQIRAQFTENIRLNTSARHFLSYESSGGSKRNLTEQEYDISIINDVMLITLTLNDQRAVGNIYFERGYYEEIPIRGDPSKLPFFDYPIKWENIYLERSGATQAIDSAGITGAQSTATAKALAQLVVITQNSNIAKIPDQMVSNMLYLKFMNGETYLYPAKVFDFFTASQVPFIQLSNPFEESFKNPNCLVAPKFYQSGIDCSILPNYGIDLIFLWCTLAINIVLSLIHYTIYGARLTIHKRHNEWDKVEAIEKKLLFKISSFFKDNYGLKMFFVKLDGTMVEVIFYSCMTLTSQPIVDLKYFYSYVVAASLMGYYVWNSVTYFRLLLHLKPRLDKVREHEKELREIAENPKKYRSKPLNYYVDFTRVKFGQVGYQIEDFRSDIEFKYLMAPVIWFLRCLAINAFLLGGTNMKSGQFYVFILIESLYLWYLVKSKVKASRFENWLSYFNEGSQIAYVIIQLGFYFTSDGDLKQSVAGLMQASLVIAIMVLNIGYVFVVFFWDILLKPIIRLCKKKSAFEKTEKKGDDAPELRLGKVVKEKNKKKLVISRAELKEFLDKKNANKANDELPEELGELNPKSPDNESSPNKLESKALESPPKNVEPPALELPIKGN